MLTRSLPLHSLLVRLSALQARFAGGRWSFALVSLLTLLQRSPVVSFLFDLAEGPGSAPAAQVLRCGFGVAAAMGAIQTLAGATTYSQNPSGTITSTVGGTVSVTFTITGAPNAVASFSVSGTLPPGLSMAGLSNGVINNATPVISGSPTTAGSYTLDVEGWDALNGSGHTDSVIHHIAFTISGPSVLPPAISTQPISVTVSPGQPVALLANATSSAALTFQWQKNSAAISGATSPTLYIPGASASDAGSYTLVATNSGGSATSTAAVVTVHAAAASQLLSLSVRAIAQPNSPVTPGINIVGTNAQTLLIRAAGPALLNYGVTDAMKDPQMSLYSINGTTGVPTKIAYDNDWDNSLASVFARVGAFPYASNSTDAALLVTLPPGLYTVEVSETANVAGETLVEVYSVQ